MVIKANIQHDIHGSVIYGTLYLYMVWVIYALFHVGATGISGVNDDLLQQSSDQLQTSHNEIHMRIAIEALNDATDGLPTFHGTKDFIL